MRTLFAKILLWFLGAMALTITAIVANHRINGEQRAAATPDGRHGPAADPRSTFRV